LAEFVPRSQQDITDALLQYAASDPDVEAGLTPTDLNVGSLERAHTESLALLLEESDLMVALAIQDAISESCYRAFGFSLLPPQKAIGGVVMSTFTVHGSDIVLPLGLQVIGPSGVIFETTAASSIPTGDLVSPTIPIRALTAGVAGNVAQDSITKLVAPVAGIDMLTNPSRTGGGTDTETTDARAVRFSAWLRTLPRGTKEALEFAALSATALVQDARSVEPFMLSPAPSGIPFAGLVWLFVDDGTDSPTLDAGVVLEVRNLVEGFVDGSGTPVPGYKAAGSKVEIRKVPRIPIYLRANLTLRPGGVSRWTAIKAALTAAAGQYFDRLRIAEKVSYQNLVTFLTDADADIAEVDLVFWKGASVPGYNDLLSAEDIAFYDPSDPGTVGSRGYMFEGSAPGPGSTSVTYPEWILG